MIARLVAKGYNQIAGIDYIDNFSPVAKLVTVRIFLIVATAFTRLIHQVDVNNAFLYEFVEENLYLIPPDRYDQVLRGKVCKLVKLCMVSSMLVNNRTRNLQPK